MSAEIKTQLTRRALLQDIGLGIARGAFLGFFAYATYDLTNQATLKDWPWKLSVIDIAWGTTLATIVSYFVIELYL